MKISIAGLLLVSFISLNAHAKKVSAPKVKSSAPFAAAFDVESPYLDSEYYKKELKQSEANGKRSVAHADSDIPAIETQFASDFLNLRSELIGGPTYEGTTPKGDKKPGVKSPEELDALINKYSETPIYQNLSPQAQLVVVQLKGLKPFKSIIYRARDFVGKHTGVRSAIVSILRNSSSGLQTFFPLSGAAVNQWDVVFRYVTEPMSGMDFAINTDTDLQAFLTQTALTTNSLVGDMVKIYNTKKPIWWDNKMYMSFANFTSEKDRYVKLGQPELATMLASGYMSLSALNSMTAYSMDGLQEALRQTGTFFGIDSIESILRARPANGISSKDRFQILESLPNLFVLTNDGPRRMKASYSSLVIAIRMARSAWEEMRQNPNRDEEFLFDPRTVIPFNRILGTSFEKVDELIAGKGAHSTIVNGEIVKVNFEQFYLQPPRSLHELFPQKFDTTQGSLDKVIDGKTVTYRNYKSGSPIAWNLAAYQRYFPEATASAEDRTLTKDVPKFVRVLSQTWGGAALGLPLTNLIF